MGEEYYSQIEKLCGVISISVNGNLIFQRDTICEQKREESSCKIGQATSVQLKQESDKH